MLPGQLVNFILEGSGEKFQIHERIVRRHSKLEGNEHKVPRDGREVFSNVMSWMYGSLRTNQPMPPITNDALLRKQLVEYTMARHFRMDGLKDAIIPSVYNYLTTESETDVEATKPIDKNVAFSAESLE
jgi:hypothetical protein